LASAPGHLIPACSSLHSGRNLSETSESIRSRWSPRRRPVDPLRRHDPAVREAHRPGVPVARREAPGQPEAGVVAGAAPERATGTVEAQARRP